MPSAGSAPKEAQPLASSRSAFAPFGWVIQPEEDGTLFRPEAHASLDLSAGQPRFYIMRVNEERGLLVHSITRHASVTQCLGSAASSPHSWYIAVASPSTDRPSESDVHVFQALTLIMHIQVPPHLIIKLHKGTWHAGPMFVGTDCFDFLNLELTDTNEVDHTCAEFDQPIRIVPPSQ